VVSRFPKSFWPAKNAEAEHRSVDDVLADACGDTWKTGRGRLWTTVPGPKLSASKADVDRLIANHGLNNATADQRHSRRQRIRALHSAARRLDHQARPGQEHRIDISNPPQRDSAGLRETTVPQQPCVAGSHSSVIKEAR
jgi:hypothetical protein